MARKDSSRAISEGKDKFRNSLQVRFVEKDESTGITEGLICAQEQDLRASSVKTMSLIRLKHRQFADYARRKHESAI